MPNSINERELISSVCWNLKAVIAEMMSVPHSVLFDVDAKTFVSKLMDFRIEHEPQLSGLEFSLAVEDFFPAKWIGKRFQNF